MTNTLISFLGARKYKNCRYQFDNTATSVIEAQYAATAIVAYLNKNKFSRVDQLVICGTQSSIWSELSGYFDQMASLMFAKNSLNHLQAELGSKEILAVNEKISTFQAEHELGKSKHLDNERDRFIQLLSELENLLNRALESVKLKVYLIYHVEVLARYDAQISFLKEFQRRNILTENSNVYLDITLGLRIMPFAVFANLQCLCQILGLNLRRIFYLPEFMPKPEPLQRLRAIEDIKGKLRYLKNHGNEKYQTIVDQIKVILGSKSSSNSKILTSSVCYLDIAQDIINQSQMLGQFNVTRDVQFLGKALPPHQFELGKVLYDISRKLNQCEYESAAKQINDYGRSLCDAMVSSDIANELSKFFDWHKPFGEQKKSRALKMLSAKYLECGNYPLAINSCHLAILKHEFNDDKTKANMKYGKAYKNLVGIFRAMFIHLEDKTKALQSKVSLLHQTIYSSDNAVKSEDLIASVRSCMKGLGVEVTHFKRAPQDSRILVSFIGSGDYGRSDYEYKDPFGSKDGVFSVSDSSMIGISLLGQMKKKSGFYKFILCGSVTSNWSVAFQSLRHVLSTSLEQVHLHTFDQLVDKLENNAISEVSQLFSEWFSSVANLLGYQIKLVIFSDKIAEEETQHQLFDFINQEIDAGCMVSFDITHCYRIIPIFTLAFSSYLAVVKNISIEHIFYGEVPLEDPALNLIYGLRKSQLPNDDEFAEKYSQICDLFASDVGYDRLSGGLYDMANIARLLQYSLAISQFKATDNPQFLDPLVKYEFAERDQTCYQNFKTGVFLNNFMFLEESFKYLDPVIERLSEDVSDPVLATLQDQLVDKLRLLVPINTQGEYRSDYAVQSLYFANSAVRAWNNGFYVSTMCLLYQGMLCLPVFLWRTLAPYKDKLKDINGLKSFDINLFKSPDAKLLWRFILNKLNPKQQEHLCKALSCNEEKRNSQIARVFYNSWDKIRNLRNDIFHASKCSIERDALDKLVKKTSDRLKDWIELSSKDSL